MKFFSQALNNSNYTVRVIGTPCPRGGSALPDPPVCCIASLLCRSTQRPWPKSQTKHQPILSIKNQAGCLMYLSLQAPLTHRQECKRQVGLQHRRCREMLQRKGAVARKTSPVSAGRVCLDFSDTRSGVAKTPRTVSLRRFPGNQVEEKISLKIDFEAPKLNFFIRIVIH